MIDTNHLLKATAAWTSIVYAVCYFVVATYPQTRMMTLRYGMHMDLNFTSGYFGLSYFISGLIIWNLITLLSVWLFAFLFNTIKK